MKRIFKYIAIVLAAVSAMPVMASAQGTVELSKKVKDNEDGTYTLTLESFVTGETVQKIVTQPCNIILLLDNSTSMYKQNIGGTTKRIVALREAASTFLTSIQESAVDGKINHNLAIVEFRYGMLRSNLDVTTDFWKNSLYSFKHGTNDVKALYTLSEWTDKWDDKNATNLGLNDWEILGSGHETSYNTIKNVITSTNLRFNYYGQTGYKDDYTGTPSASAFRKAGELIDALPDAEKEHPTIVVFFTDGQCGYAETWGTNRDYKGNNRVVAKEVIRQANLVKAKPNTTVYSIGVFGTLSGDQMTDTYFYLNHVSSKFNSEVTQNWDEEADKDNVFASIDTGDKNAPDNELVFMATSSTELNNAFKKISEKVQAASEAYDLNEESAVVLDVLTNMFKLRYPADESKIRLYTCDVVTTNKTKNVLWVSTGTVSEGGNIIVNKDADNNIIADSAAGHHKEYWVRIPNSTAKDMVEIKGDNKDEIYVTRFDYATNYVGAVKNNNGQITGWHDPGKKLIIQFDIVTDPANTGGLNLNTNEPESGIYKNVDGTLVPVEVFEEPTVQLPYLEIVKYGLADGESATFTVEKVDASGNVVTDATKYFAKVIITNKGGETAPSAVLKLLYTGHYRVTEGAWAWTYTPGTEDTVQTKQLVTVKSGDKIPNNVKFEFTDTKKTSSSTGYIEGAEDFVVNNLNTGAKTKISTGANE